VAPSGRKTRQLDVPSQGIDDSQHVLKPQSGFTRLSLDENSKVRDQDEHDTSCHLSHHFSLKCQSSFTPSRVCFLDLFGYNLVMPDHLKSLHWVGSSKKDLIAMPKDVVDVFGFALHLAQSGKKHDQAKPLRGFGGASVLEVVEDDMGDTYRAVYTVKITDKVYVLHCFQKKSTKGIETPKQDMNLIRERLKAAQAHAKGIGNDRN
jgi:phage-related protein